jgi:hypothetical protein
LEDALRFVVGRCALSFGWNEPYEVIAGRDMRLRDVPDEELAGARVVPPDGHWEAPPETWTIVIDFLPAGTTPAEVERRCRQAFVSVGPALRLLMRGCPGVTR